MAVLRTIDPRNYPAGQRTITSAAVPSGYRSFKFSFTDESWPVGFILTANFEVSPDNGTTWKAVAGKSSVGGWINPVTGLPDARFVSADIGFTTTSQTMLRGTFNANQSFRTGITIEGFA